MANAGYGNHDEGTPERRPKEERPAPAPDAARRDPNRKPEERTPGEGATPGRPQGDEADPGVG